MNSSIRLLLSAAIGTFGASLFWTGFPVYFTSVSNQNWSLSGVYSLATFGTLLCTLLGGIWGDKGNYKKLAVRSHFISMILILVILALTTLQQTEYLLLALPFLYFNFSLGYISESVWLLKASRSENLKNRIIERTMVALISKLLGFSLGPWVFLEFGKSSLFICFGAFAITCVTQYFLMKNDPFVEELEFSKEKVSLKNSIIQLKPFFSSPSFVFTAFLTGLLSIPLNPLFVSHLSKMGSTQDISMFWLFAGLSGFTATLVMRKTKVLDHGMWFKVLTISMCGFLFLIFNDQRPLFIIVFASAYVFSSIYFSAKTQIVTTQLTKKENLGSSFGLVNFFIDSGVFIGMLLGTGSSLIPLMWIPVILSVLLVLRWVAFNHYVKLARSV